MKEWKGFVHGVDLGGWLSQCPHTTENYENFITEADFRTISEWGLDHVRVPVDYDLVETVGGEYKEAGFEYIARAIAWARKYNLKMILDLHKTYGFSFDLGENESGFFDDGRLQKRFYRLWEEFTRRFAGDKDMLAFELLNEVTSQSYRDSWNRIAGECIRRIRAIDSEVTILVVGYWNNSVDAVHDIDVPLDEHIVYNFHCYSPLVFTHQGAGWVMNMPADFRCDIETTYEKIRELSEQLLPDQAVQLDIMPNKKEVFGAEFFIRSFKNAVDKAEAAGIPLYCGEYGVIDLADDEQKVLWYRAINEAFEHYGIGRAAWSFKRMNFGISDELPDNVRNEIIKLL